MLGAAAGVLGQPTSLPSPDFPWCPESRGCRDSSAMAPPGHSHAQPCESTPWTIGHSTAALLTVAVAVRLLIRRQSWGAGVGTGRGGA